MLQEIFQVESIFSADFITVFAIQPLRAIACTNITSLCTLEVPNTMYAQKILQTLKHIKDSEERYLLGQKYDVCFCPNK